MILFLDNRDSFVFNLARYFERLGQSTAIRRSDAVSVEEIASVNPGAIVVSPGPCGPLDAGVCVAAIRHFSGSVPILGVCLGHQCIGEAFGAVITRSIEPMHGRASDIRHVGSGLFEGVSSPSRVGRYHSLIVENPLPGALLPLAWSRAGEVMAMRHATHETYGVQFHPESILTDDGAAVIANFLKAIR